MTPKNHPQKIHTPKIFIFLKTSKNIEIQNFEPQRISPSLRTYENIRVPGGGPPTPLQPPPPPVKKPLGPALGHIYGHIID